jgi:hypothetical protein
MGRRRPSRDGRSRRAIADALSIATNVIRAGGTGSVGPLHGADAKYRILGCGQKLD